MRGQICALLLAFIGIAGMDIAYGRQIVCLARSDRLGDLRQLVSADGEAYKMARDSLVKTGTKWDDKRAISEGWQIGLAAFIVNVRVENGEVFEKLDRIPVVLTRGGNPMFPSPVSEGIAWQAFVLEQTWKSLWPDELSRAMIENSLMKQDIQGPSDLWQKLSGSAVKPSLRAVGVYALCKREPFKEGAAELLGNACTPGIVKRAVLSGIDTYTPGFALDLLVNSMPGWKDDSHLRYRAIMHLASQHSASSRELLYDWVLNDELCEGMRTEIVNAMSGVNPKGSDLAVYRDLLSRESLPVKLREVVERLLKSDSVPVQDVRQEEK